MPVVGQALTLVRGLCGRFWVELVMVVVTGEEGFKAWGARLLMILAMPILRV